MPVGKYKDIAACIAANKDKDDAKAYCASLENKSKGSVRENISLDWVPEVKIEEKVDGDTKWLEVSGIALEEGVSRNKRKYSVKNLEENNGATFTWLGSHPEDASHPDYVVGEGYLTLENSQLKHTGKIRNTARFPDIVEKVKDGLVVPSIQATAKSVRRVVESDGTYFEIEGLSIPGVSLVNKNFQGVPNATVEAAIAESFTDEVEEVSSTENKSMEENRMADEQMKKLEEENAELKQKLQSLTDLEEKRAVAEKESVIQQIMELNADFKKEELLEKQVSELNVMFAYEKKIKESEENNNDGNAQSGDSEGDSSESGDVEEGVKGITVNEKSQEVHMEESFYKSFNRDIQERVR